MPSGIEILLGGTDRWVELIVGRLASFQRPWDLDKQACSQDKTGIVDGMEFASTRPSIEEAMDHLAGMIEYPGNGIDMRR